MAKEANTFHINYGRYKSAEPKPYEKPLLDKINTIKGLNAQLMREEGNENRLVLRLRIPTKYVAYNSTPEIFDFMDQIGNLTGGQYHMPIGDEELYPRNPQASRAAHQQRNGVFVDFYCFPTFCTQAVSETLGTGARPNLRQIAQKIFRNQGKLIAALAEQGIDNLDLPASRFAQR